LKILGTVQHISSHRNIIVSGGKKQDNNKKNLKLPAINSIVFDQKMNRIGKVNDILGPVTNPYFSVRISKNIADENLRDLRDSHVYVK
jgi:RNA-binding protein